MSKKHMKASRLDLLCGLFVTTPVLLLGLMECSSETTLEKSRLPQWAQQPTRTVDNGYIVYVGHSEAPTRQKAQFKAEGIALEDLANECSMIAKGTRVEDRFTETTQNGFNAYAKIAIEFQTCDQASKTIDPDEIRKLASAPFTEQLRKYQEFDETGVIPANDEVAVVEPPNEIPSAPTATANNDNVQFYVVRQYVAYQKQIVILSPPNSYAPGSPQTVQFTSAMQPAVTQVQTMAATNPSYRTNPTPWSRIPNRPVLPRPLSLRPLSAQPGALSQLAPRFSAPRPAQAPRQAEAVRRNPPQKKRPGGRARRRCDSRSGRC